MAADARARQPNAEGHQHVDRRELRASYRVLTLEAKNNKEQLASTTGQELHKILEKANQLHQNVEKPKEHAVDAELFATLTDAALEAAKKLAQNNPGKGIADFLAALKSKYVRGPDPQNEGRDVPSAFEWMQLSVAAGRILRPAPGMHCMLGPLEAQSKQRKAPQQRAKRQAVEVVRPEELDQIQETEKQETDRNMEEMWTVLEKCGQEGCPVPELVCNPRSFAQTIENLFTLSFLVRDQKVRLQHDQELGMRAVMMVKRSKAAAQQGHPGAGAAAREADQSQFVMDLTIPDWEVMCEIVRAEDCRMKHREHQESNEAALTAKRNREEPDGNGAGQKQKHKEEAAESKWGSRASIAQASQTLQPTCNTTSGPAQHRSHNKCHAARR